MNGGLDDDSAQFRSAAMTIAVSTKIERNFDWRRGQLLFRRKFGAISIDGEDNCGFNHDSAQFRWAARTIAVSKKIRRNCDRW